MMMMTMKTDAMPTLRNGNGDNSVNFDSDLDDEDEDNAVDITSLTLAK